MKYDPDIHHRRSIRLQGYDYARNGAYFVTVCAQGRECLFGEIVDGEMCLSDAGRMVKSVWNELAIQYPGVEVDAHVVMPNHFHGIVWINRVGAGFPRPIMSGMQKQGGETPPLREPTLGQIIGYFKYQTTRQINCMRDNLGAPVWQRNYYERVIRDEKELDAVREYIANNPKRWESDSENPANAI